MDEVVTLEINKTELKCSRQVLIDNSDYFKAMFEGNFLESCKTKILINGVDLEAMTIILKLIWDRDYEIEEELILTVLQAACMLQFLQIQEICLEKLESVLNVDNCLKIWFQTEPLSVRIWPKAKLLALLEFLRVKESEYFLYLRFEEVVNYLGSVFLQTPNEFVVFESIIKWFSNLEDPNPDILIKLLFCLNFNSVEIEEISRMITNPCISELSHLCGILNCIISVKKGQKMVFGETSLNFANALLNSKSRNLDGSLCILVENSKTEIKSENSSIQFDFSRDSYKRKRRFVDLGKVFPTQSLIYLDHKTSQFKKIVMDIDFRKYSDLDGFKLLGFKNLIFFFGGEFILGRGSWNSEFNVYNVVPDKWRKRKPMPFSRRHFESCVCGNYLFVIGGTGPFRVIQENLFWYNIQEDEWSAEQKLPFAGRQIKCCSYGDKLFILNINHKSGCFFSPENNKWTVLSIEDSKKNLPFYSEKMSLFCYNNALYIKEEKLFELKIEDTGVISVEEITLENKDDHLENISQVESVLCDNFLYSHKKKPKNEKLSILECFNVKTKKISQKYELKMDEIAFQEEHSKKSSSLCPRIFKFFHPNLVTNNDLINIYPN